MKRISIFLLLMFVSLCTFAQTQNIIKCHTTEYMEELRRQNPNMPSDADFEREMAILLRQRALNPTTNARVGPYVIPVIVFTFIVRNHLLRGVTFGAVRR